MSKKFQLLVFLCKKIGISKMKNSFYDTLSMEVSDSYIQCKKDFKLVSIYLIIVRILYMKQLRTLFLSKKVGPFHD